MGLVDEPRPRRSRCPQPLHRSRPASAGSGRRTAGHRVERGLLAVEAREHQPATHQFRADDDVRVRTPPRDLARAVDGERLQLRLHEDVARRATTRRRRATACPSGATSGARPSAPRTRTSGSRTRRRAGLRYPRGCPRVRHRSVTRAGRSRRRRPGASTWSSARHRASGSAETSDPRSVSAPPTSDSANTSAAWLLLPQRRRARIAPGYWMTAWRGSGRHRRPSAVQQHRSPCGPRRSVRRSRSPVSGARPARPGTPRRPCRPRPRPRDTVRGRGPSPPGPVARARSAGCPPIVKPVRSVASRALARRTSTASVTAARRARSTRLGPDTRQTIGSRPPPSAGATNTSDLTICPSSAPERTRRVLRGMRRGVEHVHLDCDAIARRSVDDALDSGVDVRGHETESSPPAPGATGTTGSTPQRRSDGRKCTSIAFRAYRSGCSSCRHAGMFSARASRRGARREPHVSPR